MSNPVGIIGGASIVSGVIGARGARNAAGAQSDSIKAGISEQRAAREDYNQRSEPFRQVGLSVAPHILADLGIEIPKPLLDAMGEDYQAPTGATQLEQINPLVSFIRDQGYEDIQETAAAQGRLRSGGTLRDLTDYNTKLASTIVPQLQQQRFNQLYNLLGIGANTTAQQGTATLSTANNISDLLFKKGQVDAQGAMAVPNAIQNTISDASGIYGFMRGQQPSASMPLGDINTTNTQFFV